MGLHRRQRPGSKCGLNKAGVSAIESSSSSSFNECPGSEEAANNDNCGFGAELSQSACCYGDPLQKCLYVGVAVV